MIDSEGGRILVQRAMQNPSSKKAPQTSIKAHRPALPRLLPVWFDIRVRGEQGDVQRLQAGKSYTLAITGSLNRSGLHAEGITITEVIELRLSCELDVKALLKLDPDDEPFSLSYEETARFKEEFTISIPADFPSCHLIFGLTYTLPDAYSEKLGRKLPIEGTHIPEDQQLLEDCQIATGLPKNVAILAVSQHPDLSQQHGFKFRGWNYLKRLPEKTSESHPILNVAKLMKHKDDPATILGKIRLFSENVPECLKTWLQFLQEKYGEDLCLIIIDSTSLEIPWEMYTLDSDNEQYLGACAKVVRWIPPRRSTNCILSVEENVRYEGSVIAYLDKQLGVRETEKEDILLQKLATQRYATLRELEDRIRKSLQQVGLIYIGCHGSDGITLQQQYPDQLTAYRLVQIHKHQEPRPIALINACESSRIIRDDEWGDGSFVEILLHRCVSGYIGTMANVGTVEASHIAARIMEAAMEENGIEIAEILRQLREEAVHEYARVYDHSYDKRKEYEYNLLYTFMYVYYGNPLARLRLLIANQQGKGIKAPEEADDELNLRLPAANQKGEGA